MPQWLMWSGSRKSQWVSIPDRVLGFLCPKYLKPDAIKACVSIPDRVLGFLCLCYCFWMGSIHYPKVVSIPDRVFVRLTGNL